jgi:hypothetical protein
MSRDSAVDDPPAILVLAPVVPVDCGLYKECPGTSRAIPDFTPVPIGFFRRIGIFADFRGGATCLVCTQFLGVIWPVFPGFSGRRRTGRESP